MGYRTWFYAACVCAYAGCLSVGMRPRAPVRGHGGSRSGALQRGRRSGPVSDGHVHGGDACCGSVAGSGQHRVWQMRGGMGNGGNGGKEKGNEKREGDEVKKNKRNEMNKRKYTQ